MRSTSGFNSLWRAALTTVGAALVVAALLSSDAGPAFAKPAFIGVWDSSATACKRDKAQPSELTVMTARSFREVDQICTFRSVTGGGGVWNMRVFCDGEGLYGKQHMTVWATPKIMTIKFASLKEHWNFVRCK